MNEYSIRSFAYIFLAGYAGFTLSQLDFYFFHMGIEKNFDPLILLLINLCPSLWLKFYFTKENLTPSTMEKMEDIFIVTDIRPQVGELLRSWKIFYVCIRVIYNFNIVEWACGSLNTFDPSTTFDNFRYPQRV